MESPICGPATTILPSPTLSGRHRTNICTAGAAAVALPLSCRAKKESPVSSVADSLKSPATMSTDRWMNKTTPRGQDGTLKVGKSSGQVSPTSPIGEYLETTLRIETQKHCPYSARAFDNDNRTLLDKARSLERRNNNATPLNYGRSLPIQKKNKQVPFFVPDLEGSAADFTKLCSITPPPEQHGHVVGSQSHEQRSRTNEACPPSPPPREDSSECTSPTFHQLRNHFEAKSSAAAGNC
jgi:hypothetical protein